MLRRIGTTTKVTTCGKCGKRKLGKTIVFEQNGRRRYLGQECASKVIAKRRAMQSTSSKSFAKDIRSSNSDGYKDGLVHSDASFDDAMDNLRRLKKNADLDAAMAKEAKRNAKELRADLEQSIESGEDDGTGRVDFLLRDEENDRARTKEEQKLLLDAYIDSFELGFKHRLEQSRDRRDEDDDLAKE